MTWKEESPCLYLDYMQETDFFVAVLEGDFHLLHSKEEDGLDSLEEDADFIKWIILLMFSEGLRALFCFLFIILEYSLPFYKETKSDGLFTHFTLRHFYMFVWIMVKKMVSQNKTRSNFENFNFFLNIKRLTKVFVSLILVLKLTSNFSERRKNNMQLYWEQKNK